MRGTSSTSSTTTATRPRRRWLLTSILAGMLASGVSVGAARAVQPVPGVPVWVDETGHIPTSEECASGSANGVRHYANGDAAICAGAGGTALAYAAGHIGCGGITVAGKAVDRRDPNDCPAPEPPSRYTLHRVQVPRPDGVSIDGYVRIPEGLEGQKVPIVLQVSPYFGSFRPSLDSPDVVDPTMARLLNEGYGYAVYNVRGTGTSGGCLEFFGKREQADQAAIVERLAEQPFSNGSIGMIGLSYDSATAWEAAIAAPKALRTIVVAGNVTDPYLYVSTPQGAARTLGARYSTGAGAGFLTQGGFMARHGVAPSRTPTGDYIGRYLETRPERLCPEVAATATSTADSTLTDDRNEPFWSERRLADGLPNVKAAVLLTQGFFDSYGHQFQDDDVWRGLKKAPKRMLVGQWDHEFPAIKRDTAPSWAQPVERGGTGTVAGWDRVLVEWMDHWLRQPAEIATATADSVREGVVEHEATDGTWHTADAWPPDSRNEALHLRDVTLDPKRSTATPRSFVSAPDPRTTAYAAARGNNDKTPNAGALCGDAGAPLVTGLRWDSDPVAEGESVHITGNPSASLRVESDQPGGLVILQMIDIAPDFNCEDGTPHGATTIAMAGVDLRFANGNYLAEPPEPGAVQKLHVDFYNNSYVLESGHKLALVASYGHAYDRSTSPQYEPTITIHDGSRLVVPVLSGTLKSKNGKSS